MLFLTAFNYKSLKKSIKQHLYIAKNSKYEINCLHLHDFNSQLAEQ